MFLALRCRPEHSVGRHLRARQDGFWRRRPSLVCARPTGCLGGRAASGTNSGSARRELAATNLVAPDLGFSDALKTGRVRPVFSGRTRASNEPGVLRRLSTALGVYPILIKAVATADLLPRLRSFIIRGSDLPSGRVKFVYPLRLTSKSCSHGTYLKPGPANCPAFGPTTNCCVRSSSAMFFSSYITPMASPTFDGEPLNATCRPLSSLE